MADLSVALQHLSHLHAAHVVKTFNGSAAVTKPSLHAATNTTETAVSWA